MASLSAMGWVLGTPGRQHEFVQSCAQGSQAWDCSTGRDSPVGPRGRVRTHLWGEDPGQPSTTPTTALRTSNTSEPHIQNMCLGTHSPVGNVQHLLHQCQHVLLVQLLTHMWKQAQVVCPMLYRGLFSLWIASKEFSIVLQAGN